MNVADLNNIKTTWSENPGECLVTEFEWSGIKEATKLSNRELEVCRLLFRGRSRGEVSEELGLKFSTIRQYTEQLHSKLRVHNRVSLVLRVMQVRDHLFPR